jgi:hypothetical protein
MLRCAGRQQKPTFAGLVKSQIWNQPMLGSWFDTAKARMIASMVLGSVVILAMGWCFLWLSSRGPALGTARDYEECVEALTAAASLQPSGASLEYGPGSSTTECSERFAGRRKPGGGYTYYDFLQDRSFDIDGPNPTAEERRRIDIEYIGYLDNQRRERVSAELAKKKDEELQADLERTRQPVGPPLILTPKVTPAQTSKRSLDRTKPHRCEDTPLACMWSKLSSAVGDTMASSRTKP